MKTKVACLKTKMACLKTKVACLKGIGVDGAGASKVLPTNPEVMQHSTRHHEHCGWL